MPPTDPNSGFSGTVFVPDLSHELIYTATRSSGPGGQNVNKVSTRVELRFDVVHSAGLSQEAKATILEKLAGKITREGFLILVSQSERTQLQNRLKATEKFYTLLNKALTPRKKRKPTRPSPAAKEKRLDEKRVRSEKKTLRKPVK
jgi:ribosome-associated protein